MWDAIWESVLRLCEEGVDGIGWTGQKIDFHWLRPRLGANERGAWKREG